jgi:hypothetical protein
MLHYLNKSFLLLSLSWGKTESTWYCGHSLFGLLYQPRMTDDKCGAVSGIRIDRENRSTRIKPAPVALCPPQIPHDLNRARTRAAAVGNRD